MSQESLVGESMSISKWRETLEESKIDLSFVSETLSNVQLGKEMLATDEFCSPNATGAKDPSSQSIEPNVTARRDGTD
jgi:hypothetical protein